MGLLDNKISIKDESVLNRYESITTQQIERVEACANSFLDGGHFVKVIDGDVTKVAEKAFTLFYLNHIYSMASISYDGETNRFSISHGSSASTSYDASELADTISLLSGRLIKKCKQQGNKYTDRVLNIL